MNVNEVVDELMAKVERHCIEELGEHGGRNMAALARRGHMIAPTSDGDTPTGRCRLGGAALLEPGTVWPEIDGIPLSLLAVLDVDALAPWLGEELGASPGLLNFFHIQPYVDYEQFDGINPYDDPRSWRVVAARPESAVETAAPAPAYVFGQRPAWADPVIMLPGHEESVVDSLDLGPGNEHKFGVLEADDIYTTWPPGTEGYANGHRAFGWPWPQQGELTREGEVMLLQLGGDEEFEWGDGGLLYYMIPAEALRAGDFSQVRVQQGE